MQLKLQVNRMIDIPEDLTAESIERFENELAKALHREQKVITLNCSRLRRITSQHVSLLWQAHQISESAGLAVRLESVALGLIRSLEALDLLEFFTIAEADEQVTALRLGSDSHRAGKSFTYQFSADVPGFAGALPEFLRFLKELHLPEASTFELHTLFYEVSFNIITHGRLTPRDRITVSALDHADRVELRFVDAGVPFDPTSHPVNDDFKAAASQRRKRGLGLMMIRRLSDQLSYTRTPNAENVFSIEKRVRP